MTVRRYRDDDIDAVLDIWYRASLVAHSFLTADFLEAERHRIATEWMALSETLVWVDPNGSPGLDAAAQVRGFLSLVENEVGAIFVDPDHQGRGVGRALMDRARALRPYLELTVFEANVIGRRFYDAYGFRQVGRIDDEAEGHPGLRLRLD